MQKHKFSVTCPEAPLVGPAPAPQKNEKWCVDVLHPGRTRMRYVTSGSHGMQKHKLSVMCPSALVVGLTLGPPKNEK
jgi:hypothetical protein